MPKADPVALYSGQCPDLFSQALSKSCNSVRACVCFPDRLQKSNAAFKRKEGEGIGFPVDELISPETPTAPYATPPPNPTPIYNPLRHCKGGAGWGH